MAFPGKQPIHTVVLYDQSGNELGLATETTIATLATETKLEAVRALLASLDSKDYTTETTQATLATETKLEAVRVLLASIDGNDFATEATLSTISTSDNQTNGDQKTKVVNGANTLGINVSGQAAIQNPPNLNVAASTLATEATLDSIKDIDGIKKITDELPAGTQEIGAVKQGTKASGTGAWPQVLYDTSGNAVAVILDNSIYRLETRSKLSGQVGGAGAEVNITAIVDTAEPTGKRLQTEARLAPGSTVNIGTGIPADPAALVIDFLRNGGSEDLLVDGSGGDVVFAYTPDTGVILSIQSLLLVFTADDFSFDGVSFGPNTALSTGIKFETDIGGVVTEIFNVRQNEDFLRVPGRIPLVNNTGPKDVLGVAFEFGGLVKLSEAAGDRLIITIRDDLTAVKLKYLTATVYGAEV